MILGFVLIGTVAGMIAGLFALVTGASVWTAIAVYAGVGALCVLATIGAVVLADRAQRSQVKQHGMHPAAKRPDTSAPLNAPPRKSPAA